MDRFLEMWRGSVPFDVFLRDAPIMAHSIDQTGRLLNVSTFWATRLGYEPHEMVGVRSVDFLTTESRLEALERHLPAFWKTGRMNNVRYKFQHKDGSLVPVIMSATSLPTSAAPQRSLAVMFDNGIAAKMKELQSAAADLEGVFEEISATIPEEQRQKLRLAIEKLSEKSQEK